MRGVFVSVVRSLRGTVLNAVDRVVVLSFIFGTLLHAAQGFVNRRRQETLGLVTNCVLQSTVFIDAAVHLRKPSMDFNTSSPVLGFFQSPSQCRSFLCTCLPCCWVCSCLACSWLCSFLPAVGPLFYPLWVRSSTRCGSALLASFHQDHPSVRVHPVGCLELLSCTGSPASLFASASVSPRERRTPSFAVWCLGLSRACVLLLRSSWHSMSRSPWHSMALQRRFPTRCSPSPRADPRVFFRTLLHVLRVAPELGIPTPLAPLPSARCACRGRCPELGCFSMVVNSAACVVRRREHLVAGACASKVCTLRLSSDFALLGFPRSCTGLLWFFEFTSPSESGDQSEHGCDRGLVSPASASGVDSRRSSVIATLRSCRRCCCVPRGQRALLDADMLELIDRSACLVEPVSVESCAPSVLVLSPRKHVQRRVRSLLANVLSARPCGRSFAP